MHLNDDTQQILFFIISNRDAHGIFSRYQMLVDNFSDVPDHITILVQEELINAKYASNKPSFITVTGKGLNYNFDLQTRKEVDKRHNLWYPLLINLVSFFVGYAVGKLF